MMVEILELVIDDDGWKDDKKNKHKSGVLGLCWEIVMFIIEQSHILEILLCIVIDEKGDEDGGKNPFEGISLGRGSDKM
jgi:hypothetical protein